MEELKLLIEKISQIGLKNGLTESGEQYLKGLLTAKELLEKT